MDTAARKPDRTLLIVIATVVALVVVALVVVFSRGASEPLDESTPAGVVQRYAEALLAGDVDAAKEHLTSELQSSCEPAEPGPLDDTRVVLESTTERGDTADVEVSMVYSSSGGLFGPSEYRSEERFRLVREGSRWAIESSPWQFTLCVESFE